MSEKKESKWMQNATFQKVLWSCLVAISLIVLLIMIIHCTICNQNLCESACLKHLFLLFGSFLFILLLMPFVSEIKIFGIGIKKDIDRLSEDVRHLTNISIRNNNMQTQQVIFNLPKLYKKASKFVKTENASNTTLEIVKRDFTKAVTQFYLDMTKQKESDIDIDIDTILDELVTCKILPESEVEIIKTAYYDADEINETDLDAKRIKTILLYAIKTLLPLCGFSKY